MKQDFTAPWFGQLHDRAPDCGFAATAFSDKRQRFTGFNGKTHLLCGVNPPCHFAEKVLFDIVTGYEFLDIKHNIIKLYCILWQCFNRIFTRLAYIERTWQFFIGECAKLGNCGKQGLSIRCLRVLENFVRRAFFDLVATTHHKHAVGDLGNHAHIMGDKDHAHAKLVL